MTHTPGAWQVGRVHKGFDGPFDWGIFNHEEDLIATVWGSGECEKADARLIAAAPELLEALQRLSAQCERLRLPGQPETDAEKTARAVIAKATGGAA